MWIRTAVAAAATLLLAGAAGAGDLEWRAKLARAHEHARASEHLKAADLYGEVLAAAQKMGDLLDEQEAAEAFFEFLEKVPEQGRGTATGSSSMAAGPREAKAAVMARLDPARCGAFVSAPCLAGELILDAIRSGDGRFVPEAAAVLEPHGKGPKSGAGLKVLAMLARGAKEADAGDERAAATLGEARDAALRQDWTDVGMAAGVELAVLHGKKGDTEKAREVVASLAKLVSPKADRRHLVWCRDALNGRLKDLPAEVRGPFTEAVAPLLQKGEPGSDGGTGGAASDSDNPGSPFGRAFRKAAAGKPLATVARTADGFEFRVAWNPKFRASRVRASGVGYLQEGGLTVALANWSVGLALLDLKGTLGGPEGLHVPRPGQAFYRLAPEESWTLTKDGLVQISAK